MARLIDADALRDSLSARKMTELFPNWQMIPSWERENILKLGKYFSAAIDDAPTIPHASYSNPEEGEHAAADD